MARNTQRAYDDYGKAHQVLYMGRAGTWDGTIPAAVVNLCTFKVPANMNGEITGYTCTVGTGGTVGAPAMKFCIARSLAGTGTYEGFGTSSMIGTIANLDTFNGTMTSTGTFLSGDIIAIREVTGTVGLGLGNMDFWLTWEERKV